MYVYVCMCLIILSMLPDHMPLTYYYKNICMLHVFNKCCVHVCVCVLSNCVFASRPSRETHNSPPDARTDASPSCSGTLSVDTPSPASSEGSYVACDPSKGSSGLQQPAFVGLLQGRVSSPFVQTPCFCHSPQKNPGLACKPQP